MRRALGVQFHLPFAFVVVALAITAVASTVWAPGASAQTMDIDVDGPAKRMAEYTVAVSGDYAIVGAQWHEGFQGAAYVLRRSGDEWIEEQRLSPATLERYAHFGSSVAIYGDCAVVGATWQDSFRGAAYVFERVDGWWVERQELKAGDAFPDFKFGETVRVDGWTIMVGAQPEGPNYTGELFQYTFELEGDIWRETEKSSAQAPDLAEDSSGIEALDFVNELRFVPGGEPPDEEGPLADLPPATSSVIATDGAYEENVEITWASVDLNAIIYRITRNGVLLSVASSEDSLYVDETGTPGVTYNYCVVVRDMYNVDSSPTCDTGSRIIFGPKEVSATDGEYDQYIRISWADMSSVEAGYQIRRDGAVIDSTGAGIPMYNDSSTVPTVFHTYEIFTFDDGGNLSAGMSDTGFRGLILPPLEVSASDGEYTDRVVITWIDQVPDEDGYILRRNGTVLDTVFTVYSPGGDSEDNTSYDDMTATFGVEYSYCVTTLGPHPDYVLPVESIPACDPGGRGILPAPTNVSATDSTFDDGIEVTWGDPSELEHGFEIWRNGLQIDTVDQNVTYYKDEEATAGATVNYCIVAYSDSGGRSVPICDDGFRMIVMAPTEVKASDGDYENRVEISWNSTSTTAVLYKIFRDATFIKSVSVGGRTYTDYGGTAGQDYTYSVIAVTALGDESDPGSDVGRRELRPPETVTASDDEHEDRVLITWADASVTEHGYVITREDTLTAVVDTLGTKNANSTEFLDYTGVPLTTYMYRVAAFDTLGEGIGFSGDNEDLGRRVLNPPYNVQATDGDFEGKVELTWNDNCMAEDGYNIYRNGLLIDSVGDNTTSYFDMSPEFGAVTDYHVRAFDALGESNPTADGSSDTGYTTILPPGSLSASDTYTNRVHLTWVDVSQIESKYIIIRDGVVIDSTSANAYSYNDYTATQGTTYEYCVLAKWCDATCSKVGLSVEACDDGLRAPYAPATGKMEAITEFYGGPRTPPVPGDPPTAAAMMFGRAVAIDGDLVAVGAPGWYRSDGGIGRGYVFERDASSGIWNMVFNEPQWTWPGVGGTIYNNFGDAVDVSGDIALFGAPGDDNGEGAVQVAERDGIGNWGATARMEMSPSDPGSRFGCAVALQGEEAVIGALGDNSSRGAVYVYTRLADATWTQEQKIAGGGGSAGDRFGSSVAVDVDMMVVGAPATGVGTESGEAYIFERDISGSWVEIQKLTASDGQAEDEFGSSVSIHGDLILVGAREEDHTVGGGFQTQWQSGAAYIFTRRADGTWVETQKLIASDGHMYTYFGESVSINNDVALIGCNGDDEGGNGAGAAYMYTRGPGNTWSEYRKLTANDTHANHGFGSSVAMNGDLAVIGAWLDNDYDSQAGSAYLVDLVARPGAVSASDGDFNTRVRLQWDDRSDVEDGYRVYRDGDLIATLSSDTELYEDNEAKAGRAYTYGVESFASGYLGMGTTFDYGWRPPDGNITGRIQTFTSAGLESVLVCLDPPTSRALLLDGEGGQARIRDDGTFNFNPSDSFTLELWFSYNGFGGTGGQNDVLIAKAEPGTGTYPFMLSNRRGEGYVDRLSFKVSDGSPVTVNTGNIPGLSTGWHHVACVHDAGQSELRVYVDGQLEGTTSYVSLGSLGNLDDLMLGIGNVTDGFFAGRLDEVRIWNDVRTVPELADNMTTLLAGDEDGLKGYWPLDGGVGGTLIDLTDGASYGLLEGGAHWSADPAPLETCAYTDLEGNYSSTGIRYGDETTFKVRPYMEGKQFSPVFKMITLNPQTPVENQVDFFEVTSYTVSGQIKFAGRDCDVPNVGIYMDGQLRGSTDKRGKFWVAVTTPGEHWFRPRLDDHAFSPDSLLLVVEDDFDGADFEDTTLRTLSGRVGGGCDRYVGRLTIDYVSENNCMSGTIKADSLYSLSLPPQKYFVTGSTIELSTIPDGLDKADVVRFYKNLGMREVDLTGKNTELDFTYRGPLLVNIKGFDSFRASCPLTFEGRTLPDKLPVIDQGTLCNLIIEVNEYYGEDGDGLPVLCPLDSGKVVIYDEIKGVDDEPLELTILNGTARDTSWATVPSLIVGRVDEDGNDRSFQKAYRVVVLAEGKDPVTATEWALVTGNVAPEGADFVTYTTDPFPMYILRDPPGDKSQAWLEEGYSGQSTIGNFKNVTTVKGGIKIKAYVGLDQKFWFGFGAGQQKDFKAMFTIDTHGWIGGMVAEELKTYITYSFKDKYSTSSSSDFIGEEGDVFIGTGINYIFSEVRLIEVDGCEIKRSTQLGYQPGGFGTTFAYTEKYIRETLVPQLERSYEAGIAQGQQALADSSQAQMAVWSQMLEENRRFKREAKFADDSNRSFSAGANYSNYESHGNTEAFKLTLGAEAGVNLMGGLANKILSLENSIKVYVEVKNATSGSPIDYSKKWYKGVGYTLSDDDDGDHFTVNIGYDDMYPCPVFDVLAGVSSCPHEPWTDTDSTSADFGKARMLKRDGCQMFIRPSPIQGGINKDEPAVFALDLVNNSETHEERDYVLKEVTTSNPGGAIIKANGQAIIDGIKYAIEPDATQEVTLTVERGPSKYRYEDLEVKLASACDGGIKDTQKFTVYFDAPCTDVTMVLPEPGWAFNKADQDTLDFKELLLADYEWLVGETTELRKIGGQYRRMGTGLRGPSPWTDIGQIDPDSLSTVFHWPITTDASIYDGVYELRGFTQCDGGRGYSSVATGTIDRKSPEVFGKPQPSDGELCFGEDISINFDEPIDCRSINPDSVKLMYISGPDSGTVLPTETVCDGRKIFIKYADGELDDREDTTILATVQGITDLVGNSMEVAETWQFFVKRRVFAWSTGDLTVEVPFRNTGTLTAKLVNGSDVNLTKVDYDKLPPWIVDVQPEKFDMAPGSSQEVSLVLDPTLAMGTYSRTIRAEAKSGPDKSDIVQTDMTVNVTVSCMEPDWDFYPGNYEKTMTIVARVDIGGVMSSDPNDMVVAMVANQIRGVATMDKDTNLAYITVHSNRSSGETVRFQVWDNDGCQMYNSTLERYAFVADGRIGSPGAPVTLTAVDVLPDNVQTIPLGQGWDWFSMNLQGVDMSVNGVLSDLVPKIGDVIKSQSSYAEFDPVMGWTGTLMLMDNASSYMIHLSEPGTILLEGSCVDASSTPVPVEDGWNWIGCLLRSEKIVGTALGGLSGDLLDGDLVKSQDAFAQFASGAWHGDLDSMSVGAGYKLYMANAGGPGASFYYPGNCVGPPLAQAGEAQAAEAAPEATEDRVGPDWVFNARAYQYNMTVTAVLKMDGQERRSEGDMIGAFVGDECRGVTRPIYLSATNRYVAFLMVHSNDVAGENVIFKAFVEREGAVYGVSESIRYEADGSNGTLRKPTVLNTDAFEYKVAGAGPRIYSLSQNVPNPFSGGSGTRINFTVAEAGVAEVRIFDVSGRLIRKIATEAKLGDNFVSWDGRTDGGRRMASGVYFYQLRVADYASHKKMLLTD